MVAVLFCAKCLVPLRCKKNGVVLTWAYSNRRAGDLYECPACGCQVIEANRNSYQSESPIDKLVQYEMEDK